MISVQVRRRAGDPSGFTVTGHAGHGARGADIVCAGVSALTDTVILGLERLVGANARVEAGSGMLACDLPEELAPAAREQAALLIETMLLGLQEIARAYPGRVELRDPGSKRGENHVPV